MMKQVLKSIALSLTLTVFAGFNWGDKVVGHPADNVTRTADRPASDFVLIDQEGRPFHLSQLRGKVVLLFFGYTHCPDACPTTMAKLSRVYKLQIGRASCRERV